MAANQSRRLFSTARGRGGRLGAEEGLDGEVVAHAVALHHAAHAADVAGLAVGEPAHHREADLVPPDGAEIGLHREAPRHPVGVRIGKPDERPAIVRRRRRKDDAVVARVRAAPRRPAGPPAGSSRSGRRRDSRSPRDTPRPPAGRACLPMPTCRTCARVVARRAAVLGVQVQDAGCRTTARACSARRSWRRTDGRRAHGSRPTRGPGPRSSSR